MIRAAIAVVAAVALVGAGAVSGAVAAPQQPRALCIPLLMDCSGDDSGGSGGSGDPVGGLLDGVGGLLDGVTDPVADAVVPSWGPVTNETGTVFTQPAAQLEAGSLSITGLHSLGLARVPLSDGSHKVVIKIVADRISIDGFVLDVKGHAGGTSLVTDDSNMTLSGHVQVYLDSLTASTLGGVGLSLLANTPPPGDELPPKLLRVTLGLVGVTADSITHTNTHQAIHEGKG